MSKFFGKVKLSFKEDLEPNEILLDRLANKKEEEMGFSERKFEIPIFGRAIEALFFCSLFILFLLFAKTFQLQIVAGKSLSQQAEDNKFIYYQLRAERGVIYDNALNQLVFNRPSFDLVLEKSRFPESDSEKSRILNDISQILKISLKDLQKKIGEANGQEVLIAENLDHQALIILETKIKELQGFQIENSTTREYVDGENYAHLLGYTGKIRSDEFKASPGLYFITDEVGRSGVEAAYEEVLRKNFGQVKVERDARGNIISKETVGLPQPGKSLVLWLDSVLQKKIEEELKRELGAVGSSRGVAVAIDPKTGGILAMVSLPSFDNNIFPRGDQKEIEKVLNDARAPLFNRVISGQYPTGSSIKPLMA
ncbi:MAG: penicillin-binding transpeptidase domain-containing protein, partial [bacterium]|nr:penicillin-binding transpeptidase domain-containing protein [bacterium]